MTRQTLYYIYSFFEFILKPPISVNAVGGPLNSRHFNVSLRVNVIWAFPSKAAVRIMYISMRVNIIRWAVTSKQCLKKV